MKNSKDILIEEDASMERLNTFNLKGKVKLLVHPYGVLALKKIIEHFKENNIKYHILGLGSNVIFENDYYDGAIVRLTKMSELKIKGNIVHVTSGYPLIRLCNLTVQKGLKGLEFAIGIPGTVGGAIYQNAGAHGHEISEFIEEVKVLKDGEVLTLKKDELSFSYRSSMFKEDKDLIILSATLKLEDGDKEESEALIKEYTLKRRNTQPIEYPTAGSVFRNPPGMSAGAIIDELGLKGMCVGGASVSKLHANFIINEGHATGKDIITLISLIQNIVKNKKNIDLTLEQEIIK